MTDRARASVVAAPRLLSRKAALTFVILLGTVSLLADFTYEGSRSITGPFLQILGASGAMVGFVAGFGELAGHGLRLLSGVVADRTRRYWAMTLLGYSVNLLAVPLLALADRLEIAVSLIIAERVGKAIRTPARDAMLAHATGQIGHGKGFGLHEAMDQIGAVAGPLVVATVLHFKGNYAAGFAVLAVPATLALGTLLLARRTYPNPVQVAVKTPELEATAFPRRFWTYLGAVALIAAGYADFPLIAYHFQKEAVASGAWIPIFYAAAMAADAVAALVFGYLFDRIGVPLLIFISILSSMFAPLVFWGGFDLAFVGIAIWGVGLGAQESIMKAAIADMIPRHRRATAYGLFNGGYGLAWFLGSAIMGFLYDFSLTAIIAFSVATQLGSVYPLYRAHKMAQVRN